MLSNGKGMALTDQQVVLGLSDLRGVDGTVSLRLGEQDYTFHSGSKRGHLEAALIEPVRLDAALMDGQTAIPFRLTCSLRGSSSLMVKPYGETTEVRMKSNCPDPSFTGDFLPAEREVTDEGFTARWSVSEINRGAPDDTSFGVSLLQGVTQYQQAERSAKGKTAKAEGEKFLQENALREEVKTTESGLQYEVLVQGKGKKPTAEQTVKVHYEGTLIDGTVFDSSYQRGEPIEFPLNGVIKGWTEGLQLMPVGSIYKLYIPYELGYGEHAAGQSIPPYSTLIFKVELLDIK